MLTDEDVIQEISDITGVAYSDEQKKILTHKGGMCILACAGSGKALVNGTGVLTPRGYIAIEELQVGDYIYGADGTLQRVRGVFPQGKKRIFEVRFADESTIKCCEEHLWTFKILQENKSFEGLSWKTKTVREILDNFETELKACKIVTPLNKPIQFEKQKHEVSAEAVVLNVINAPGFAGVPDDYTYSSLEDREEILKAFIKYSGEESNDYATIRLKTEGVCKTVKFIIRSLGMVATHRVDIRNEETPYIVKILKNMKYRRIMSIVETSVDTEMTCIKVSNSDGLFVVDNCIVTHNTTVLTHLLAKRIKTGEIQNTKKLLCTTFSKAGSEEMQTRLEKLLKRLGIGDSVEVRTLHSSYFLVLKHFGIVSNNVCSNPQRSAFVMQAVKETGVQIEDEDLQLIDSLLSYQVNNLLDDQSLVKSYVYTLDDLPLEKYSEIRRRYCIKKQEAGVIDFDDMQMYMYTLLVYQARQDVIEFCRNMWEYFFVDEFQDVSKIQFAILRALVTSPDKLIVIGDDDQCIYQWRGADPNIILNICGYYDIQNFVLSTNYRCGGEIVDHAAVCIKNNEKRANKDMVPFNKGGKIKICDSGSSNMYTMSKYAYTYVMQLITERHVEPESIAVLCRNNLHLAILNNMLFKSGVYSESAAEMKMTNMSMYKDIKSVLEMADNTFNHHVVGKNIWKMAPYLGVKGAKIFYDFMNETGCNLKDSLGYILSNFAGRNSSIGWTGRVRIPEKVSDRLEYRYAAVKRETEDGLIMLYKALELEDETEKIAVMLELYIAATEFMHKSGDKARTVNGLVDYVKKLIKEEGLENTKSWLATTEQYESGKAIIPGAKITMSTMHGAKGREWQHVILFAVDNVTFPSFEGINTMLMDRIEMKDISGSIDENRRLAYVGMTRAKEELAVFTDKMNMSVYLLEALGLLKKDGYENNAHIISMATDGGIPVELLRKAEEKVFTDDSPYLLKVDIKESINRPTFIESGDPDADDFMEDL